MKSTNSVNQTWQHPEVPSYQELMQRFTQSQQLAFYMEIAMLISLFVLGWLIDWPWVLKNWLSSLVVVCIVPFQYLPGLAMTLLKKKKSIDELSESARFGEFNRHHLRQITREVARDLDLPTQNVPVFITSDKDLNAMAVGIGLSRFLPMYRGVYLHRQTLHIAGPDELRSWIGHEMGHLYPFAIRADQDILLKLLVGSLVSLLVLQFVGIRDGLGIMAAAGASFVFLWLIGIPRHGMYHVVEYLCDGCSVQAAGLNSAITDLLKLGREAMAHHHLVVQSLQLAREGKVISEGEALRIYEDSLGYGPTDQERTMQRIRQAIREKKDQSQGFTWSSLFDFFWRDPTADSDAENARNEILENYRVMQKAPCLDWSTAIQWDGQSTLSDSQIAELIRLTEQHPDQLLFRSEGELVSSDTHPSIRNRVVYLWKNQHAIASKRA